MGPFLLSAVGFTAIRDQRRPSAADPGWIGVGRMPRLGPRVEPCKRPGKPPDFPGRCARRRPAPVSVMPRAARRRSAGVGGGAPGGSGRQGGLRANRGGPSRRDRSGNRSCDRDVGFLRRRGATWWVGTASTALAGSGATPRGALSVRGGATASALTLTGWRDVAVPELADVSTIVIGQSRGQCSKPRWGCTSRTRTTGPT